MAPANPGGGWDQTSRALEEALESQQIASQPIEVFNRGGAGGTVGLAELIAQSRGDGHTVMTMGLVMTGAILTNQSPVNLSQVTPAGASDDRVRGHRRAQPARSTRRCSS